MQDLSAENTRDELARLGIKLDRITAMAPALAAARLVNYSSGDTLFRYGEAVEALTVIRNGRVKLLHFLANGKTRIVRLHNRGSILGLNGLVNEVHSHTAVAIDDVEAYLIPVNLLLSLKSDDPESCNQLLEHWHEYLAIADTWITDFSTGSIRGRVARLILYLTEADGAPEQDVNLLTVEEMAEILGVTPESVSRVMADFKRKRILISQEEEQSHCFHCDLQRLEQEAEQ